MLMPPAINIVLIVIALLLMRRFYRTGMFLALSSAVSLWLLSTMYVSGVLANSIERYPAFDASLPGALSKVQAIVVLGSGHYDNPPEYGVSTPLDEGLARLHYAASLHRRTNLPIMLTGGPMNRQQDIHSEVLAESLEKEFKIKAMWLERESATTWQNAANSADILFPLGIKNIALVTHSYHMQRAVNLFESAGFNVTPAPTQLSYSYPWQDWRYWLPQSDALMLSSNILQEYLGLLWYRLVNPADSALENNLQASESG